MRLLRWLLWLVLLALITGGVYFYLERGGRENAPPAASGRAVDQTDDRDQQQLNRLIERLQKEKP